MKLRVKRHLAQQRALKSSRRVYCRDRFAMATTQHSPAFLALVEAARREVHEIAAAQLQAELQAHPEAALIDVREESEFAAGHVRGAEHIGKGVIERDIEKLHPDKNQPLYLYCGGGFRSALAAHALGQMGYSNVVSVDGGWKALSSLLPTET
ncbi:MAG: rhodanese-like domain-containing protein [Panacagrimonas sp.]